MDGRKKSPQEEFYSGSQEGRVHPRDTIATHGFMPYN
jgi:hypothetical protein